MKIRNDNQNEPLIRWQFARGRKHVMCAIRATAAASYEVATVPLWDVGKAAIETFKTAGEALRRHAAISASLRETGWTIASYTSQPQEQQAA